MPRLFKPTYDVDWARLVYPVSIPKDNAIGHMYVLIYER